MLRFRLFPRDSRNCLTRDIHQSFPICHVYLLAHVEVKRAATLLDLVMVSTVYIKIILRIFDLLTSTDEGQALRRTHVRDPIDHYLQPLTHSLTHSLTRSLAPSSSRLSRGRGAYWGRRRSPT
eukprot:754001-Prorocentrum_minimum.AAC.4